MNLHNIISSAISAVNPFITGSFLVSNGYTTTSSGKRVPSYNTPINVQIQMQALSFDELKQVDGLNIQGEKRAMYVNGDFAGVQRPDNQGGDLITLPDGSKWLIVLVLENWNTTAGWTKFAVTRQMGA